MLPFLSILLLVSATAAQSPEPARTIGLQEYSSSGWSPRPTTIPQAELIRRQLEGRQLSLSKTCGYFQNAPLTCPSNSYCASNTNYGYMACCATDIYGNWASDCFLPTVCLDAAESRQYCGINGCSVGTALCGRNPLYPECVTMLVAKEKRYTMFYCGTVDETAYASTNQPATSKSAFTSYANPFPSSASADATGNSGSILRFGGSSSTTSPSNVPSPSSTRSTNTISTISSTTTSPMQTSPRSSSSDSTTTPLNGGEPTSTTPAAGIVSSSPNGSPQQPTPAQSPPGSSVSQPSTSSRTSGGVHLVLSPILLLFVVAYVIREGLSHW